MSSGPQAASPPPLAKAAEVANERPEIAVGGALAGGFLLAMILKRLAR